MIYAFKKNDYRLLKIRKAAFLQLFLHGRRDSNSRHLVLETSALPTELHPCFNAIANIVIHSKLPKTFSACFCTSRHLASAKSYQLFFK